MKNRTRNCHAFPSEAAWRRNVSDEVGWLQRGLLAGKATTRASGRDSKTERWRDVAPRDGMFRGAQSWRASHLHPDTTMPSPTGVWAHRELIAQASKEVPDCGARTAESGRTMQPNAKAPTMDESNSPFPFPPDISKQGGSHGNREVPRVSTAPSLCPEGPRSRKVTGSSGSKAKSHSQS